MQNKSPSPTPPTERVRGAIERLIAVLDPDYPSVFVPGAAGAIDEPAAGYMGSARAEFIAADDAGWGAHDA